MIVAVIDDDDRFLERAERWVKKIRKDRPESLPDFSFQTYETVSEFKGSVARILRDNGKGLALVDLDINGDKRAGIKLLEELRADEDPAVRAIPVIIYSNSKEPVEVSESYANHANCFVWKGRPKQQKNRFEAIIEHWAGVACVPLCD